MSSKSKRKLSSRRFERHQETRKDPNKPWYESSGLSPRESSTQSKSRTKCTKRCGWSSGYFEPHPRQRSLQRVHLANASFADLKVRRNRDTISFYVVTPKDLRRKRKIWSLLKNRCGTRDMGQVFATYVEESPNEHDLQKDALVPWWYWKATLKTCNVHWGDGFIPAIVGVRANDLEQLMREKFRVRACEHVDPGSLTTMEILCRKVAWNAENFRIYDPKRTLALADEFGFRWQATTRANEEHPCDTWFENDERTFAWRCRRLGRTRNTTIHVFDWHSTERWTGQTRNTIHNGRTSEIHV